MERRLFAEYDEALLNCAITRCSARWELRELIDYGIPISDYAHVEKHI
jgi:hypothetical protein